MVLSRRQCLLQRNTKKKKQAQQKVFSIFVILASNLCRVSYISTNSIQGRHGILLAGKTEDSGNLIAAATAFILQNPGKATFLFLMAALVSSL